MSARAFYGGRSGYDAQIPADRGLLAWTQPPHALAGGTAIPTAGLLYLRRVRRVPAGPVTSIVTHLTTLGVGLTAGQCFAALYTAGGTLIAQTADQATAWASAGLKVMTLTGGPYTVDAGDYYVGFWFNGTTGPAPVRSASISALLTNVGLTAPNLETASANPGVTTTAPASLGAQTSQAIEWWFALA